jgi:hypothetical protein
MKLNLPDKCYKEGVLLCCPSFAQCPGALRHKHLDEVDSRPHSKDDIDKVIEKLQSKAKKEEMKRIKEEKQQCKPRVPGLPNINNMVPPGMSKVEYLAKLLREGIRMSNQAQGIVKDPTNDFVSII